LSHEILFSDSGVYFACTACSAVPCLIFIPLAQPAQFILLAQPAQWNQVLVVIPSGWNLFICFIGVKSFVLLFNWDGIKFWLLFHRGHRKIKRNVNSAYSESSARPACPVGPEDRTGVEPGTLRVFNWGLPRSIPFTVSRRRI